MSNPGVTALFDIGAGQTHGAIGVVELLRAFARGPLRQESGKRTAHFVTAHAITALVRTAAGGVFHMAAGDGFRDDIRDFPDAVVLFRPAYIKGFVVNRFAGSLERLLAPLGKEER